MPHKSVEVAEKAAIEGDVEEWDTQQCRALNEYLEAFVVSGGLQAPISPNCVPNNRVAFTNDRVVIPTSLQRPVDYEEQENSKAEGGADVDADPGAIVDIPVNGNSNLVQLDQATIVEDELNP
ncbi:hypothetical protein IFR05_016778 [Cadophora sp. M221]|nr:hypothetical protein IFR05_016778 [Cadophora sp. M221]